MKTRTSSWHRTPLALAALVACAFPCHADESAVATAPDSASPMVVADGEMVAPRAPSHPTGNPVSARALQADGALPEPAAPRAVEEPPPAPLRWTSSAQLVGSAYRLSLSRGPLDIGMSFDTPARTSRPLDPRIDTQGPVMSTLPSVSLGFRQGGRESATAGSLLARATSHADNGDYTSKVGIQWKPAESNVSFIREGLGFRLDGNERVTMKLRKGMLGVYMQRKF